MKPLVSTCRKSQDHPPKELTLGSKVHDPLRAFGSLAQIDDLRTWGRVSRTPRPGVRWRSMQTIWFLANWEFVGVGCRTISSKNWQWMPQQAFRLLTLAWAIGLTLSYTSMLKPWLLKSQQFWFAGRTSTSLPASSYKTSTLAGGHVSRCQTKRCLLSISQAANSKPSEPSVSANGHNESNMEKQNTMTNKKHRSWIKATSATSAGLDWSKFLKTCFFGLGSCVCW